MTTSSSQIQVQHYICEQHTEIQVQLNEEAIALMHLTGECHEVDYSNLRLHKEKSSCVRR